MVRQKSIKAQELNHLLNEATIGIETGLYKSLYAAAKVLGLRLNTVV